LCVFLVRGDGLPDAFMAANRTTVRFYSVLGA
jgi:hypothetical protein